jgi:hypothetical protein
MRVSLSHCVLLSLCKRLAASDATTCTDRLKVYDLDRVLLDFRFCHRRVAVWSVCVCEIRSPSRIGAGVKLFFVGHYRAILGCWVNSTCFRERDVVSVAFIVDVLLSNVKDVVKHHLRTADARRLESGFNRVDQVLNGLGLDSHFCVLLFGVCRCDSLNISTAQTFVDTKTAMFGNFSGIISTP